jgi:hypothetical protein
MTSVSNGVRRSLGLRAVQGASLFAVALSCFAGAARAESDAETRTLARELARRGAEAFDQKDYTTALDSFDRAETLFHAPSISVMRARSLVALGRLVEALDVYEATQRTMIADNAPAAYREAVADAARESEELRKRVPRLTIRARVEGEREGAARIVLDGKPVPEALVNVERPIDPGRHEITADAPGHAPATRNAVLNEGDRITLEMVLSGPSSAQPAPKSEPAAPASVASSGGSRAAWGWSLASVGVAGMGVGAVTGIIALGKKSSLDSECRPACPPAAASDIDAFRTHRTLSYVSFAVGATALGVGGYLLLSGRPRSEHVAAAVGPRGVFVTGAF